MSATTTSPVDAAVDDITQHFGADNVHIIGHDNGGTWVRIDEVELSVIWAQPSTFVIVHLASTLPFADIYPVFVRADLSRVDGKPLQAPVTAGHCAGPPGNQVPAVQLSRRTRGDASRQTAGQKITKVLNWLRELP